MKKKIFFVLFIALFSVFGITACNSKSTIKVDFDEREYIVSRDETIDFFDHVTLKGITKSNLTFVSSNTEILNFDGNKFKALDSGEVDISARYRNQTVSSVKVFVRYEYSSPKNIKLQEDGKITWDKEFVFIDSKKDYFYASEYELSYAYTDQVSEETEFINYKTNSNYFQLTEEGTYFFKIKSISNSKYIISSPYNEGDYYYYNSVGHIENLEVSSSHEFANQNATFSWDEQENTCYDVYIDDFKIYSNLDENEFSFDFSIYSNLSTIKVDIIAKDKENKKFNTTTTVTVRKAANPVLSYDNSDGEGSLIWDNTISQFGYTFQLDNGSEKVEKYIESDDTENIFGDMPEGFYTLKAMSCGGTDENEILLNSNSSTEINVVKLAKPNVALDFNDSNVKLTFEENDYVKKYKISYGEQSFVYDTANGLTKTIDMSSLEEGLYSLKVYALPSIVDGQTEEYTMGDKSSRVVLSSDPFVYEFAVLGEIEEVSHTLQEDVSTISFASIENANYYEYYINDELISTIEASQEDDQTIVIDSLKDYAPANGTYKITIIVEHKDNQGKIDSIVSKYEFNINILDVVEEGEYENGSFAWIAIDDHSKYQYEIYKTENDYVISGEALHSGLTEENEIAEILDFGYYVIKVKTISTNEFELNSDFYNEEKIFTKNFIVTRKIETPNIEFIEGDSYKLKIETCEYASEYKIYINDEYEDSAYVNGQYEFINYVFANDFSEIKKYKIEVVAVSGDAYDGNIHLDSDKATVNVEKLKNPEFTIEDIFNSNGVKTRENFAVTEIENVKNIEIKLDGQKINTNNESIINLMDYNVFGEDFSLIIKYIAQDASASNYYIDSNEISANFTRLTVPTDMKIVNGEVTFEVTDTENIENIYLEIELVTDNGNFYFGDLISNNCTLDENIYSFDIQTIVDNFAGKYSQFNSVYRNSKEIYISLNLISNNYDEENNLYTISSRKGLTSLGETKLKIEELSAPVISFNKNTREISWTSVKENTVYDIYVNNAVKTANYTQTSINLNDLVSENELLNMQTIYIKAKNTAYLNSQKSNEISIKKLDKIKRLTIANADNDYIFSISILKDSNYVEFVYLNGSDEDVTFAGNVASFKSSDFDNTTSLQLQLIGKTVNETYYLNSDVSTFAVDTLENQTFEVEIDENYISYNALATDIKGNNINPIEYSIIITDGDKDYTIKTDETSYSILEIENEIGVKVSQDVSIKVIARVGRDYYIDLVSDAKCYYGEIESNTIVIEKLKTIGDIDVEIVDDASQDSLLDKKLNAYAVLTFENLWGQEGNAKFNIKIEYEDEEKEDYIFQVFDGVASQDYSLVLIEDNYKLTLKRTILDTGINNITLLVSKQGAINSETKELNIQRLESVTNAEISDSGILVVNDFASTYLVQISINNTNIERIVSNMEQVDLMDENILQDKYGLYEVNIIAIDASGNMLPSKTQMNLQGYKIQGLDEVTIADNGKICLKVYQDDLSNLVWNVKTTYSNEEIEKEFTPVQDEEDQTIFTIEILELIEMFKNDMIFTEREYTFSFTVKKTGAIDGDWKDSTFNYRFENNARVDKGYDLTKSYIILDKLDNDTSLYFRARFTIDNAVEYIEEIKFIEASSVLGYWIETEEGFRFSKTQDSAAITSTECYGIDANDLLSMYSGTGTLIFTVEISRTLKNNNDFYQYSKNSFTIFKLNGINDSEEDETYKSENNFVEWTHNTSMIAPSCYYVKFYNVDKSVETYAVTYQNTLDLRSEEAGLIPGDKYRVSVIAASSYKNVICSRQSNAIDLLRYTTPPSLEIKEGKIVFKESDLRETEIFSLFVGAQMNPDYEGGDKIYDVIKDTEFHETLFAPISEFINARVKLKFVSTDEGGSNARTYYISVPAFQLMPDFKIRVKYNSFNVDYSYIEGISVYADNISGDSEAIQDFKDFAYTIERTNQGIGYDKLLFDDVGKEIPAGNYKVSVLQSNYYKNKTMNIGSKVDVESLETEAIDIYLSASPEVQLKDKNDLGESDYKIIVSPNKTLIDNGGIFTEGYAQKFKMILRETYTTSLFNRSSVLCEYDIEYVSGEWQISYQGQTLSGVIQTFTENGKTNFKIDAKALREKTNEFGSNGNDIIRNNRNLRVDIYSYSGSTNKVINGKSAVFTLNYLDLKVEDYLIFNEGVFKINVPSSLNNYNLLVKYKPTNTTEVEKLIKITNGQAKIDLTENGGYSYMILSLYGTVSANVMNVQSERYAITNIYKLSKPDLSTYNNNLRVKYNTNDTVYNDQIQFALKNNVYSSKFYDISPLISYTSTGFVYEVGKGHESEARASEFIVMLKGNTGNFTLSDEMDSSVEDIADYMLNFSQSYAILSSSQESIKAKMIDSVENFRIEDGNIVWTNPERSTYYYYDSNNTAQEATVVNLVAVEYYNRIDDEYELKGIDRFYTTGDILDSDYLDNSYDYYRMTITSLVGKETGNNNDVKSLENKNYNFNDEFYYQDEQTRVLRSKTFILGETEYIGRAESAFLASDSVGIDGGIIKFMIKKPANYDSMSESDIIRQISIFAEYQDGGTIRKVKVNGTYQISQAPTSQDNLVVTFTLNENEPQNTNQFKLKVYLFENSEDGNGKLSSSPLTIDSLYKLIKVTSDYIDVDSDNGKTILDFSKYFNRVKVNDDNMCYKIFINDTSVSATNPRYEIQESGNLTIQAKNTQEGYIDLSQYKKVLNSDKTYFTINETPNSNIDITWNENYQRFDWENSADGNYEYFVNLVITLNNQDITEKTITRDNFYMPINMGNIKRFTLMARKIDIEENNIYIYSEEKPFEFERTIAVNLFKSGKGTSSSPYIIESADQFINISKRNQEGKEIYFKINQNITEIKISNLVTTKIVDGNQVEKSIFENFYGKIIGNNKTIGILSDRTFDFEGYSVLLPGLTSNTNFNKYSSLFEKIASSASIENLTITYKIQNNALNGENILYAPIALYNYGNIENVTLSSFEVTNLAGNVQSINNICVGGITSFNIGSIKNCKNNISYTYTMAQRMQMNFALSGITTFNITEGTKAGLISNCFNKADKEIKVVTNDNTVYLAGLALINNAKILVSGNDGKLSISASASSYNCYASGITLVNINGRLEYVYNNGEITKKSTAGTLYSGGVAYSISNGTINTLVNTTSTPIVSSCARTPTNLGTNYAQSSTGVPSTIVTRSLEAKTIATGTGYSLIIQLVNNSYIAKIS